MDNFKTIYKILRALERAMDDENFSASEISHEAIGITEARWSIIMEMLISESYIQGASIINSLGNSLPGIKLGKVRITLKGLEYLEENSMMKKAGNIVKGVIDVVK